MTRREVTTFEDDLDGSTLGVSTVDFALEGVSYEIDLSRENAAKLRRVLQPYIDKARQAPRARRSGPQRTNESRERSATVRRWAREQGIPVDDRGRIPARVERLYASAHSQEGNAE